MKRKSPAKAPPGLLHVGTVAAAHGVAGSVKVIPHVASLDFFAPGERLRSDERDLTVMDCRRAHGALVLSFEGVGDRDAASLLRGARLFADRSRLPALEEGEYYWADVIGLAVFTVSGKRLGTVTSIIETGANDVYAATDEAGGETLIPALEWVIREVDIAGKRMVVDLPEGL